MIANTVQVLGQKLDTEKRKANPDTIHLFIMRFWESFQGVPVKFCAEFTRQPSGRSLHERKGHQDITGSGSD